jgi:beta-mannosidase
MTPSAQRLSLDGADWRIKPYIGEDWLGRDAHKPGTADVRGWLPARVPGSVHNDLWLSGEIPDPYVGRNSLLLEWIPQRTWVYRKTFRLPKGIGGKRLRLRFNGVDYAARFFLNGEALGQHTGMFTPAVFDISRLVHGDSDNLLAVVIDPAPAEQPQVGYTSQVRTTKTRMNYWWDFCPRMVHLGLWDGVLLEASGPVRIEDVWVQPQLADDLDTATVNVEIGMDSIEPQDAALKVAIGFEGQTVVEGHVSMSLPAGSSLWHCSLPVRQPHLWWPNGHGGQPLYSCQVAAATADAPTAHADTRRLQFGLRRLAFEQNRDASQSALPYTLVVNNRPVYIKGWNWVPMDVLYGVERPAKLNRLLELARRAHVTMLRVWGGGLIERETFYNRCDQLGLLVWQEFIQSSSGIENNLPESDEYIAQLAATARQVIRQRRNHPSLAVWCGGNELQAGAERPLDDSHPALAALRAAVEALDPGRHWLPTSPSGPVFSNSVENIVADPRSLHDVHGPWEHQGLTEQFRLFNQGTSHLHSEFGVEGITNRRALDAVIPPEHQQPVSLDNAYWHHLGAWWVKAAGWPKMWGNLSDVGALVRATQFSQAEGLRYAVEANRRRKYANSGSLPWQFNEPYPMAACTSAVDYFSLPKPVYYAVARAYAPMTITARFDRQAWQGQTDFKAEVWANDSGLASSRLVRYEASLVGASGQHYRSEAAEAWLGGNGAARLGSVRCPLAGLAEDVFFLDLQLDDGRGAILAANRYLFSRTGDLAPMFDLPASVLALGARRQQDHWVIDIQNQGEHCALLIWLEDTLPLDEHVRPFFADNYFCLLPGEARAVRVDWNDVAPEARRLVVGGWNTPQTVLP